jgi:hypothetical protein
LPFIYVYAPYFFLLFLSNPFFFFLSGDRPPSWGRRPPSRDQRERGECPR